jgi:hypothetical protein
MISFNSIAPLAAAAGLVVAAPAVGGAASTHHEPIAHAAGGDPTPIVPALVGARLDRAHAELASAAKYADENDPAKAVVALTSVRSNLAKAWTAAKYVIKTAPPPAGDDATGLSSGDGGGPAYATPEETGFAVLTAQHDAVATAASLADSADGALLAGIQATVKLAQAHRSSAVAFIHRIAPPAGDDALSSGTEVVGWEGVMPNVAPQLDDEVKQATGTLALVKLPASSQAWLTAVTAKSRATLVTVKKYWPPQND